MYTKDQVIPFIEKFTLIKNIKFIGSGDDSEAFCVNNEFIFKFPKHNNANISIKNEIKLLKNIQNIFEIEIPNVIYENNFIINKNEFTYFVSKKLKGKSLTKREFLSLGISNHKKAARAIACFLKRLHSQYNQNNKVLLHGDFSLNHILFYKNEVSGILDFADNYIGNYKNDFKYLLDNEDPEEFGKIFGEMVLEIYDKI